MKKEVNDRYSFSTWQEVIAQLVWLAQKWAIKPSCFRVEKHLREFQAHRSSNVLALFLDPVIFPPFSRGHSDKSIQIRVIGRISPWNSSWFTYFSLTLLWPAGGGWDGERSAQPAPGCLTMEAATVLTGCVNLKQVTQPPYASGFLLLWGVNN